MPPSWKRLFKQHVVSFQFNFELFSLPLRTRLPLLSYPTPVSSLRRPLPLLYHQSCPFCTTFLVFKATSSFLHSYVTIHPHAHPPRSSPHPPHTFQHRHNLCSSYTPPPLSCIHTSSCIPISVQQSIPNLQNQPSYAMNTCHGPSSLPRHYQYIVSQLFFKFFSTNTFFSNWTTSSSYIPCQPQSLVIGLLVNSTLNATFTTWTSACSYISSHSPSLVNVFMGNSTVNGTFSTSTSTCCFSSHIGILQLGLLVNSTVNGTCSTWTTASSYIPTHYACLATGFLHNYFVQCTFSVWTSTTTFGSYINITAPQPFNYDLTSPGPLGIVLNFMSCFQLFFCIQLHPRSIVLIMSKMSPLLLLWLNVFVKN